jgi:hypothetical protein
MVKSVRNGEVVVGQLSERGLRRGLGDDLEALALQLGAQHFQHAVVVVDDENASIQSHLLAPSASRVAAKARAPKQETCRRDR